MFNLQQDFVYIGADCLNNRIYMHHSEGTYVLQGPDGNTFPVTFQCGSPTITGTNGFSNEALIMILIDRVTRLNISLYSPLNGQALNGLMTALRALNQRNDIRQQTIAANNDANGGGSFSGGNGADTGGSGRPY